MVPAECEDGRHDADEVTKQDIKSVMSEITPSSAGDVDTREERNNCEYEKVNWRRCSLVPRSDDGFVMAGGIQLAVKSRKSFVLIGDDLGSFPRYIVA